MTDERNRYTDNRLRNDLRTWKSLPDSHPEQSSAKIGLGFRAGSASDSVREVVEQIKSVSNTMIDAAIISEVQRQLNEDSSVLKQAVVVSIGERDKRPSGMEVLSGKPDDISITITRPATGRLSPAELNDSGNLESTDRVYLVEKTSWQCPIVAREKIEFEVPTPEGNVRVKLDGGSEPAPVREPELVREKPSDDKVPEKRERRDKEAEEETDDEDDNDPNLP